jgi:hypothetical protein
MDILAYEYIFEGLKQHNENSGKPYGNVVVSHSTRDTTYPHTVFNEIRNTAISMYNTRFDRVSSVGYTARIYAKTKGKNDKQIIAREVAQMLDKYLSGIGLIRVSFNADEALNDGSIYEIIITYTGNLHENRRKFI